MDEERERHAYIYIFITNTPYIPYWIHSNYPREGGTRPGINRLRDGGNNGVARKIY